MAVPACLDLERADLSGILCGEHRPGSGCRPASTPICARQFGDSAITPRESKPCISRIMPFACSLWNFRLVAGRDISRFPCPPPPGQNFTVLEMNALGWAMLEADRTGVHAS